MLPLVSGTNSRLPSVNHAPSISDSPSPMNGTSSIGSIDSPFSSSITLHSFIPGLKSSFSTTTSHRNLLFLLQDWLHRFPGLFSLPIPLSISIFFFLVFGFWFLVPCGKLSRLMSVFERTLNSISYSIVPSSSVMHDCGATYEVNWR